MRPRSLENVIYNGISNRPSRNQNLTFPNRGQTKITFGQMSKKVKKMHKKWLRAKGNLPPFVQQLV